MLLSFFKLYVSLYVNVPFAVTCIICLLSWLAMNIGRVPCTGLTKRVNYWFWIVEERNFYFV